MLKKKLFRTIRIYKTQFISMIIMVAIATGMFLGFNIEWYSIKVNTEEFYEETKFADYRIYNQTGFSYDDLEKIKSIEGIEDATRCLQFNATIKNTDKILSLITCENMNVSNFINFDENKKNSGMFYDVNNTEGLWISDKFANINNISLNDKLVLEYKTYQIEMKVVGLIKSSEFTICLPDKTQLMPDYKTYGYAYISPNKMKEVTGIDFYSQINIISDLEENIITEKIDQALGKTTILVSKDNNISYSGPLGEIDEGKTMSSLLPVFFLIIGILIMITTMFRLVTNEQTQIGILKSLGFKDNKIAIHYTLYSFVVAIFGSLLGIALGFFVAYMIMNPNGAMGTYIDMPYWKLYIPWFGYIVIVLIIVLLTIIGYISIRNTLKKNACDILKVKTAKSVKPLLLEKTKLWQRFKFDTKWNIRDIMRHKIRSLVSLFGVIGCTILIIASLGMKDTMDDFMDVFYNESIKYENKIYISDGVNEEIIDKLITKYKADYAYQNSVKVSGKTYIIEIYNINNNLISFVNYDYSLTDLINDGVYINLSIAEELDLKVGDIIKASPFNSNKEYKFRISKIIRNLNNSIVMSKEYAEKVDYDFSANILFTKDKIIEKSDYIINTQSKQNIIKSFKTFSDLLNIMVILLIVVALILGGIVLYNLGIMSYMERYKEMATLKVLGFNNKTISKILIKQNLWITFVGLIIGLPLGNVILNYVIISMASEYEMLPSINLSTYVITSILTICLSYLISLLISKKNKKIDMIASLKG